MLAVPPCQMQTPPPCLQPFPALRYIQVHVRHLITIKLMVRSHCSPIHSPECHLFLPSLPSFLWIHDADGEISHVRNFAATGPAGYYNLLVTLPRMGGNGLAMVRPQYISLPQSCLPCWPCGLIRCKHPLLAFDQFQLSGMLMDT